MENVVTELRPFVRPHASVPEPVEIVLLAGGPMRLWRERIARVLPQLAISR